jgi:hypothetical protein
LTSAKLSGSSGGVKAGDIADLGDHEHHDVAPGAAELTDTSTLGSSLARWSWSISRVKSPINASVLVMSVAPETRDGYGREAGTAVARLDA